MWNRAAVQATGEDLLSGSAQQAKRRKRKQQNMFVAKSLKKYHQRWTACTIVYADIYCYMLTVLRQFGYMALGAGLGR